MRVGGLARRIDRLRSGEGGYHAMENPVAEDIARYRELIKEIIQKYAQYKPSVGDIETEVIFDEANGHYELIHAGWTPLARVHGAVIHIRLLAKVYS
jgi:hypothetical protein